MSRYCRVIAPEILFTLCCYTNIIFLFIPSPSPSPTPTPTIIIHLTETTSKTHKDFSFKSLKSCKKDALDQHQTTPFFSFLLFEPERRK